MQTMTKMEVMAIARRLLQDEGLEGWAIGFNNNRARLGVCKHRIRTIEFSTLYLANQPREAVLNTIKHEVAHAAVGSGHGHGPVWRAKFMALGGNGERQTNVTKEVRHAVSKYAIKCAVTDNIVAYRQRRNRAGWSCTCHGKTVTVVTLA